MINSGYVDSSSNDGHYKMKVTTKQERKREREKERERDGMNGVLGHDSVKVVRLHWAEDNLS